MQWRILDSRFDYFHAERMAEEKVGNRMEIANYIMT